jgi:hypothetical protein
MWNDAVVTNKGKELLAQWAGGEALDITRAASGQGTVAVALMMAQTGLVGQKQNMSIIRHQTVESGVRFQLQLTSQGVATPYIINQIGVFAKINTGAETLLALFQDSVGVSVPTYAEMPDYVFTFYATVQMSNDGSLSVTVDHAALVTRQDFTEALDNKVDKEAGKGLSANDYTIAEKNKLAGIAAGAQVNTPVNDLTPTYTESELLAILTSGEKISIAFGKIKKAIYMLISHITSMSNPHDVTKAQVGLGDVDNTSDANKPVSTAAQTALNGKAAAVHSHTVSDISGILGTAKGGVGSGTGLFQDVAFTDVATGEWSPRIDGRQGTPVYWQGNGTYFRIGNICHISGTVVVSSDNGSGTSLVTIRDLPFPIAKSYESVKVFMQGLTKDIGETWAYSQASNNRFYLTSTKVAILYGVDVFPLAENGMIFFSGFYTCT